MRKLPLRQDAIVSVVLEHTYRLSGCTPDNLWPEDKLTAQIGLSSVQIEALIQRSARDLEIDLSYKANGSDLSLRDVVNLLRQFAPKQKRSLSKAA